MIMERTRRVFQFEGEPRKKREKSERERAEEVVQEAAQRSADILKDMLAKNTKPRTEIGWAAGIPLKAQIKIRFLLENLPSEFWPDLYMSAESRDSFNRNMAGASVLKEMLNKGYDFRRVVKDNLPDSFNKQEFYELWKGSKCIARLVIDANGEAKMVKVM